MAAKVDSIEAVAKRLGLVSQTVLASLRDKGPNTIYGILRDRESPIRVASSNNTYGVLVRNGLVRRVADGATRGPLAITPRGLAVLAVMEAAPPVARPAVVINGPYPNRQPGPLASVPITEEQRKRWIEQRCREEGDPTPEEIRERCEAIRREWAEQKADTPAQAEYRERYANARIGYKVHGQSRHVRTLVCVGRRNGKAISSFRRTG